MQLLNKTTGIVEYNGEYIQFPGIEAYQHKEISAEFEIILSNEEKRDLIREEISNKAGDNASLLGTTADGVQLLLFAFSQLTVGLHQANSLAEVREAAAPFNELATSFLAKVASGEVKLPFHRGGLKPLGIERGRWWHAPVS